MPAGAPTLPPLCLLYNKYLYRTRYISAAHIPSLAWCKGAVVKFMPGQFAVAVTVIALV